MRENPEQTFALAGCVGVAPQGRPQEPLVPAEHALRLPPLPVHPPVPAAAGLLAEPPDHLPAVLGLRPPPAGAAAALSATRGCTPRAVPIAELQAILLRQGAWLRPSSARGVEAAK